MLTLVVLVPCFSNICTRADADGVLVSSDPPFCIAASIDGMGAVRADDGAGTAWAAS